MTSDPLHPGIAGRQEEMAALVCAVRRIVAATVLNRAEPGAVDSFATELTDLAGRLESHIPDPRPSLIDTTNTASPMLDGETMAQRLAFDVVIGPYSPLALPIAITFEPPRAIGHAVFTAPYEGPPGCVHGAVIAAAFDIVLTAANIIAGTPGLTVSLTTTYRLPTLLDETAEFEAWVDRTDGRRVTTLGRIMQRGSTTAEAEGVFAPLGPERSRTLAGERRRANGDEVMHDPSTED